MPYKWTTADGTRLSPEEMSNDYLVNAIAMIVKGPAAMVSLDLPHLVSELNRRFGFSEVSADTVTKPAKQQRRLKKLVRDLEDMVEEMGELSARADELLGN